MDFELKDLMPEILQERRYWLVRSMGGDYYGEYISRGFIAIGYNEISLNEIKLSISKDEGALKELKSIIDSKTLNEEDLDYYKRFGAPQLIRFYKEIKEGDIVIIPSAQSYKIAIGIVESNTYELLDKDLSFNTDSCQFKKRRKITILKELSRNSLNPEMQLMFNSRHAISNVDKYAEFIDGCIRDFYQKGDITYLVLRVRQENEIRAVDFNLVPEIINLIEEFSIENDLAFDKDIVKMKICVQSPGDILVFAQKPEFIFLVGVVITFLKGAQIDLGKFASFKIPSAAENTAHIIKTFGEFLDRRQDRKFNETMRQKVENMDIENPDDITKILSEFHKGREKY
ncbi:MAG: hypothetical protein PHG06_21365 [Parabacteroides sp.]|nr:hypothetical protein [Parabacteroides sp.]